MAEAPYSIFNSRTPSDIHSEIQEVYLENARPWVIGYSGGKDSTTALQLIWYALSELPPEQRKYPVYVISSDTLVETPVIVSYITGTLDRIEQTAREQRCRFRLLSFVQGLRILSGLISLARGTLLPTRVSDGAPTG